MWRRRGRDRAGSPQQGLAERGAHGAVRGHGARIATAGIPRCPDRESAGARGAVSVDDLGAAATAAADSGRAATSVQPSALWRRARGRAVAVVPAAMAVAPTRFDAKVCARSDGPIP